MGTRGQSCFFREDHRFDKNDRFEFDGRVKIGGKEPRVLRDWKIGFDWKSREDSRRYSTHGMSNANESML